MMIVQVQIYMKGMDRFVFFKLQLTNIHFEYVGYDEAWKRKKCSSPLWYTVCTAIKTAISAVWFKAFSAANCTTPGMLDMFSSSWHKIFPWDAIVVSMTPTIQSPFLQKKSPPSDLLWPSFSLSTPPHLSICSWLSQEEEKQCYFFATNVSPTFPQIAATSKPSLFD